MELPEKPPKADVDVRLALSDAKFRQLVVPDDKLRSVLQKANVDYLYWNKFKYLKFPEDLTAQEGWIALKAYRDPLKRKVSLKDLTGSTFHYFITPSMQSLLSKIDQYAAGTMKLSGEEFKDGRDERFIISSLMEEAIASSQIEGAATTRPVAKQLLRNEKKPIGKDQKMIANNYRTMVSIRESWQHKKMSPNLIHEIHKSMTEGTLKNPSEEGRYRTPKDDSEGLAVWSDDHKLLHELPSASKVSKLVEEFCAFANQKHEDDEFMHPVIKAILLHFWLAYIHPYVDGNGRTARALFYWYMLSQNYWLFEYLSISRIINHKRVQYLKSFLYTEYDDCDLNYFIMDQLRAIMKSIEDVKEYILRKQKEDNLSRNLLQHNMALNERQRRLLYHATRNPDCYFTIISHKNATNVVYQTARSDLLALVEMGFLEQRTEGRTFLFFPVKNLTENLKIN